MLEKIRTFKPGKLVVKCDDFENVLKKHKNDFLYCDPPYYIGSDSKMFKGVYPMRNIPVHHKDFPHEKLRDMLKKHKVDLFYLTMIVLLLENTIRDLSTIFQVGNTLWVKVKLELEKIELQKEMITLKNHTKL